MVLIKWAEGTTTGQQEEVAAKLGELPGRISEIAAYSTGMNAGVDPGGYEFAIVADFADRDGYLAYRDHPDHRAVVETFIAPIVAERAAVQYEM